MAEKLTYEELEKKVKKLDCLYDIPDLVEIARIDEKFTQAEMEKIEIIETLRQIVYVDGKMDRYEHYLMNKLKTLLRLSQDQLIDAKLKVLSRLS
jgi:hypothetical protein